MHLCLASKFLIAQKKPYSSSEKEIFLRATSFPDIYKLGVVTRKETHDHNVTLKIIRLTPSIFKAGKKFHVWVDETRERLVEQWDIYDKVNKLAIIPTNKIATFLKLVEDAILFNMANITMLDTILLFSTIDQEAYSYNISTQKLLQWHAILTIYLSTKTSWLLKLGSLLSAVDLHWQDLIPKLAQEQVLIDYVDRLLKHFEELFKKDQELSYNKWGKST